LPTGIVGKGRKQDAEASRLALNKNKRTLNPASSGILGILRVPGTQVTLQEELRQKAMEDLAIKLDYFPGKIKVLFALADSINRMTGCHAM
jgi:hypothetical protein